MRFSTSDCITDSFARCNGRRFVMPIHYFGITDLDLIADGGKSSEEKIEISDI